jgi:hypothetical protein
MEDSMKTRVLIGLLVVCVFSAYVIPVMAADDCVTPLTQGYWKNHADPNSARYDDAWDLNVVTSLWGQTFEQILTTPAKGNAWYLLAHQYIAARLNILNGAHMDASLYNTYYKFVRANYLQKYNPDDIAKLKGSDPLRQQFIFLADLLDNFNNGL